jgi:hypothetical protein
LSSSVAADALLFALLRRVQGRAERSASAGF